MSPVALKAWLQNSSADLGAERQAVPDLLSEELVRAQQPVF